MSSTLTLYDSTGNPVQMTGDDLLTYGIESGSNENGNYIKYPDGTMIQWNVLEVGGDSLDNVTTVTYPLPFTVAPVTTVTATHDFSTAGNLPNAYIVSRSLDTCGIRGLYVVADGSGVQPATFNAAYQAIGRWK